ncbi:hypothetical protein B9Z19DRAFT_1099515 [Tuber borchii]|uniref:Uncharacterized protein n=1 Tax=Tuber borchii TaxID=42251 RepID=A0A2T7A2I1_TUBBO|nr:hypothetical protein B9Z19DRAFT_1099515 [Tuber borchii]
MTEPYTTNMLLYPVTGKPDLFAPLPTNTTLFPGGGSSITYLVNYGTVSVPSKVTSQSSVALVTTGVTTVLQTNAPGYLVAAIGQSLASIPSLSYFTASTSDKTASTLLDMTASKTTATSGVSGTSANTSHAAASNNKAATAVAGVMGGLFVITLLRKSRKDSFHSPPMMAFAEASAEKDQSPISELSAANTNLISQLEERNAQLSALQATLMRSNRIERLGHHTFQVHGTAPRSFAAVARDLDFPDPAI